MIIPDKHSDFFNDYIKSQIKIDSENPIIDVRYSLNNLLIMY